MDTGQPAANEVSGGDVELAEASGRGYHGRKPMVVHINNGLVPKKMKKCREFTQKKKS
ncbi:MAG: hypothetical protein NT039_04145 [Candidatus Berkelbacteria bacterium]|nr:hypothetical protein [Candidatus Berkelbacteria bacterium]